MSEKIQKVLARIGVGSRRQIEAWIAEGRVRVDGEIATIGLRIDDSARVQVDGKNIPIRLRAEDIEEPKVLLYHKPEGEVCTRNDPEGRPTVFDKLPALKRQRWVAIGRLDINTSGLLLFTNDGELAHRLLHPSYEIEREYAVRVLGVVTPEMIKNLKRGVELEDGFAAFSSIVDAGGEGANHWYHVVLKEGRHREARRLWESQGIKVSRLIRIRFGNVVLPRGLRQRKTEYLEADKIKMLNELVGLH